MNTDNRIEAAARALASLEPGEDWPTNEALGGSLTGTRDDEYRDGMREQAKDALDAADYADGEQGIQRVHVDDAAVERMAKVFYDAVNPQGRYKTTEPQVREHYLTTTLAALSALTDVTA